MRPLLLLGLALLSSCSFFGKEEEPPEKETTRPRLVGRVASLQIDANFVLIEAYGAWRVPEGGLLSSVGTEGRTATLFVTGERMEQYIAADIRSGLAKVGDSVYFRPVKDLGEGPASVDPPVPSTVPPEIETQKNTGELPAKP